MDDKRKKIIVYLHPSIYPQDILTQHYAESLPAKARGEFYRQSLICGAALSSIDPRLVNLISGFFNGEITAVNVIKLIEKVTGFSSEIMSGDVISSVSESDGNNIKSAVKLTEKKAIENLSMLKK